MTETPTHTIRTTGKPVTERMMFFRLTSAVQIDGVWRICNGHDTLTVPKHIGDWLTQGKTK